MTTGRPNPADINSHVAQAINRPAIGLVAAFVALLRLYVVVWIHRPPIIRLDFSNYYTWAYAVRLHINPYCTDMSALARQLEVVIAPVLYSNYPPTCLLIFEPLTLFSPVAAYWIWISLSVILLIVVLGLMLARKLPLPVAAVAVLLAVFYSPLDLHFDFAQLQIAILLLLVLVMRELGRDRDISAGLLLALAGLLKVYPLFMVMHLVCYRRWRAVTWTALGLATGFALTVLVMGSEALSFFRALERTAVPGMGGPMLPIVSIPGVVYRVFNHFFTVTVIRAEYLPWIEFTSFVLSAPAVILALTAVLRTDEPESAFGLLVATIVLITPIAWPHYMVLLLLPLSQLAIAGYRGKAPRSAIVLGIIAYLLPEIAYQLALNQLFRHARPVLANRLMEGMSLSVFLTYAAAYSLVQTDRGEKC